MSYDQLERFCSFGAAFKLTVLYFDPSINTLQEKETTLNSKDIRLILFDFICILETKTQGLAKLMTIFVSNAANFFFTYSYIMWCIYISKGSVVNGTQKYANISYQFDQSDIKNLFDDIISIQIQQKPIETSNKMNIYNLNQLINQP